MLFLKKNIKTVDKGFSLGCRILIMEISPDLGIAEIERDVD